MVYDGLMNLSSVKDTRRLGPDGKPLFFPLHFSLGATDADQNVAPGHALREDQKSSRAGMTVLAAPLLHHGTLALWNTGGRAQAKMKTMNARGGGSFAPSWRSLIRWLCWPAEKGRPRVSEFH
jgi:hypothetical protein